MEYNSIINEFDENCNWRGPLFIQSELASVILEPVELRDMGADDIKDIVMFCLSEVGLWVKNRGWA